MKRKIKWSRVVLLLVVVLALVSSGFFIWNRLFSDSLLDPALFVNRQGIMEYKDTRYISKIGIDVSDHQEEIDWKEVKKSGIQFAMIRCGYRGATEGKLHEDRMFHKNMQEAIAQGIDVGVYFYSTAINDKELKEEIDFVLEQVKSYKITYPIAYDMETYYDGAGRIDVLNKEEKTDFALWFTKAMRKKGYDSLIYGNKHWLTNDLDIKRIQDQPIWYAAYQDIPELEMPFYMWQYTDSNQVPGISTVVDMNIQIIKKEGNRK